MFDMADRRLLTFFDGLKKRLHNAFSNEISWNALFNHELIIKKSLYKN